MKHLEFADETFSMRQLRTNNRGPSRSPEAAELPTMWSASYNDSSAEQRSARREKRKRRRADVATFSALVSPFLVCEV